MKAIFSFLILLSCSSCIPAKKLSTEKFRADLFDAGTEVKYLEVTTQVGVSALLHLQSVQDKIDGYPRNGFDPFTHRTVQSIATLHAQSIVFHSPNEPYLAYYVETPHVRTIRVAEMERLKTRLQSDASVEDYESLTELSGLDNKAELSEEWTIPTQ
jgi:hypothetical protein